MKHHFISAPDGARLHVAEAGRADAPAILFLHGWSQSWLAWSMQMRDGGLAGRFRLLAADLRGHGLSEAPADPDILLRGETWAGDVKAVIRALEPRRPTLVGWSYGGSVICDYLKLHGAKALAGVNLVAPAALFARGAPEKWYGPGLLENVAGGRGADMEEAIAAMRGLLRACFAAPPPADYFEVQLAASMLTPPAVRGAMLRKPLDYAEMFAALRLPVLLSHGRADQVVRHRLSEALRDLIPGARLSSYENIGHCPHAEAPARFNAELIAFAAAVAGDA